MLVASQYYRPPFPHPRRWSEDLAEMRATGLDAIYVWATWAWVEPEEGRFVFDDFDELLEESARNELGVVITAVAELNPYWIHDRLPDSHHVDHRGQRVPSTTLAYSPLGLAPGGCTDHPGVRELIGRYLEQMARHFSGARNLHAWDCWNEIRLFANADAHVCACEHTLRAYRDWLRRKYGDLDALNAAWGRRHGSWEEVPAGLQPGRSWVETLAYQEFLSWRTAEHLSFMVASLRNGDPEHPVLAHSVELPSFHTVPESPYDQALMRGNDHELSRRVDAFGISLFPAWFNKTAAETGARLESGRCAAGDRPLWVCELQGGAAARGFRVMDPVPADLQQRWIWTSYGRGAKAVSFWCWRDEVFGRESGGFGVAGGDGHGAARLAALRATTAALREHEELLDAYVPMPAQVAVAFEPLNHQLEWAQVGHEDNASRDSVGGYLTALECLQVPYDVLATSHLGELECYSAIFLPWPMIVRRVAADALAEWVEAGGTLVFETQLDAFDEVGYYRYESERPLARRLGITGLGRRPLPTEAIGYSCDGVSGELPASSWIEPFEGHDVETLAAGEHGTVIARRAVGAGEAIAIGTHAGRAYRAERSQGFERLLGAILERAEALPALRCDVPDGERLQWRQGRSGEHHLLFVTNAGPAGAVSLTGPPDMLPEATAARDLLTGRAATLVRQPDAATLSLQVDAGGSHVIQLSP